MHDLIRRAGGRDTSIILIDEMGENLIISDTRRAEILAFDEIAAHLPLTPDHLQLLQGNLSQAVTQAAIAAAHEAGAMVALNAAPMRPRLVDADANILIVNQGEAAALAGMSLQTTPEMLLAALAHPIVVLTLGGAGCLLRDQGQSMLIPAPSGAVRDSAAGGGCVLRRVFRRMARNRRQSCRRTACGPCSPRKGDRSGHVIRLSVRGSD